MEFLVAVSFIFSSLLFVSFGDFSFFAFSILLLPSFSRLSLALRPLLLLSLIIPFLLAFIFFRSTFALLSLLSVSLVLVLPLNLGFVFSPIPASILTSALPLRFPFLS